MTAHLLYYWVSLSFDAEDIVFLNKKYIHLLKKRICIVNCTRKCMVLSLTQTDSTLFVGQQLPNSLMLHVISVWTPFCILLRVVGCCCTQFETGQTFEPTTFLLFCDCRSVGQQFWICSHLQLFQHCWGHRRVWSPNSDGLYPSHDALQAPMLSGVDAPVSLPLLTWTQQLPTLFTQQ